MRTKICEAVWRLETNLTGPKPAVYLVYDGLAGLSERKMIPDLLEELERQGPHGLKVFLDLIRKNGSAEVQVYFNDFVSYGIGGGEATSEFFFGTFDLFDVNEQHAFHGWKGPGLAMMKRRAQATETTTGERYERYERAVAAPDFPLP